MQLLDIEFRTNYRIIEYRILKKLLVVQLVLLAIILYCTFNEAVSVLVAMLQE
jgi:hypothetical protein